jgi:predicted amidophosphoribosyltransferase
MKCATCGTENDPANRFCDQCGSRLEPSGGFAQAQVAVAQQPTAAAPVCPSCGATVLPGEAFCDECGASLSGVAPVATSAPSDAPTIFAAPSASPAPSAGAAPAADQASICPACGHQNLPGDRFCDNCGSSLVAQPPSPAPSPAAVTDVPTVAGGLAEAPTMAADADLLRALNEAAPMPTAAPPLPESSAAPTAAPPSPDSSSAPTQLADAQAPTQERPAAAPPQPATDEVPSLDKAPTQEQPALEPAPDQATYEAERQRLEEEIARQQQIIAQLEQMEAMFGAAIPPAVKQGLAEARDARTRAEAELAALQPPAPAIDPAEVARLEEEIARQQQIITQLEQMEAMFGAAVPPAVKQGLAEARDARARAEAELAALRGGAAAPSPAGPPEASAAAVSAPPEQPVATETAAPSSQPSITEVQSQVPVEASAPSQPAAPVEPVVPTVPPVAPTPAPAPAPRLVVDESGKELLFPADKREIIVGREDPISGIFPEIDLTAHGGETGGVSRQHARISRADGQWVITDLNSTNYTRVNGNRLNPSTPVPITDGAKIQFGRVALTFRE